MKKAPKIILIGLAAAAGLLLVVAGVVVLALDSIVKTGTEKGGSYALKVPVRLDSASVSLLGGSAELRGLAVDNPPGYDQKGKAVRFGQIRASVALGTLRKDVIEIPEVIIRAPEVYIEGSLKDGSNLNRLLKNLDETIGAGGRPEPGQPAAKQAEAGKRLKIGRILIEDAKVSLGATVVGGQAGSVTLPRLELKDIGTGPDGAATPAEVGRKVLGAILVEASRAGGKVGDAARQITSQAGSLLRDLGTGVKETGKGIIEGVKGIFKKDSAPPSPGQ